MSGNPMPTSAAMAKASTSTAVAYAAMPMNGTEYTESMSADPWLCLIGLHHDFPRAAEPHSPAIQPAVRVLIED